MRSLRFFGLRCRLYTFRYTAAVRSLRSAVRVASELSPEARLLARRHTPAGRFHRGEAGSLARLAAASSAAAAATAGTTDDAVAFPSSSWHHYHAGSFLDGRADDDRHGGGMHAHLRRADVVETSTVGRVQKLLRTARVVGTCFNSTAPSMRASNPRLHACFNSMAACLH